MNVTIVGTGYVGLVTGACLAAFGHDVTCVDNNPQRVAALKAGECPIFERGLPELIQRGINTGKLRATGNLAEAVASSALTMICVGTPSSGGRIDLSLVREAARQIGAALREVSGYHVVVVKSTVVPGTTETLVREAIASASGRSEEEYGLCMNPEFLSQGSAVADFMQPDRIILGAANRRAGEALAELYRDFSCPKLTMALVNAELVKYAANSFQASLISFANQIAVLCEHVPGADEAAVMRGVHLDRMLTRMEDGVAIPSPATRFLRAGIGFGGSCFPKDLVALRYFGQQVGAPVPLLDAILDINDQRPGQVVDLLEAELGSLDGRRIAILGLAFKPDTDDLRESRSLALIERLAAKGASLRAHDPLPQALDNARLMIDGRVLLHAEPEPVLEGADAAVLATAWPVYREWNWERLARLMRHPLLLDARNLFADQPPRGPIYRRIGVGMKAITKEGLNHP